MSLEYKEACSKSFINLKGINLRIAYTIQFQMDVEPLKVT